MTAPNLFGLKDPEGQQVGLGDCKPTLYEIKEVRSVGKIILVEGEHDADAINALLKELDLLKEMRLHAPPTVLKA